MKIGSGLVEIVLNDLARTGRGVGEEFAPRVNGCVDPGVNIVADDGTKLATPCFDQLTVDHAAMVFPVVAEIRSRCAGTKVDAGSKHGVTNVGEVTNVGFRADDRVLNLDGLPNVAVVADGGISTEVAVRANLAVLSDDNVSLDVNAWENAGSSPDLDQAIDDGMQMDIALDFIERQGTDEGLVRL